MYLHLDPEFKPQRIGGDRNEIEFKSFEFSGGEQSIKIKPFKHSGPVVITTRLTSSSRVMELLMATDALKRMGYKKIDLFIPYMPYARQDRLMVSGESLSIKVLADLINSQCYNWVYTFDIHNEASLALFNNISNETNHHFVKSEVLHNVKKYILVSPDAGAAKKIHLLAQHLGYKIGRAHV